MIHCDSLPASIHSTPRPPQNQHAHKQNETHPPTFNHSGTARGGRDWWIPSSVGFEINRVILICCGRGQTGANKALMMLCSVGGRRVRLTDGRHMTVSRIIMAPPILPSTTDTRERIVELYSHTQWISNKLGIVGVGPVLLI